MKSEKEKYFATGKGRVNDWSNASFKHYHNDYHNSQEVYSFLCLFTFIKKIYKKINCRKTSSGDAQPCSVFYPEVYMFCKDPWVLQGKIKVIVISLVFT